jgi:hypothetical protein
MSTAGVNLAMLQLRTSGAFHLAVPSVMDVTHQLKKRNWILTGRPSASSRDISPTLALAKVRDDASQLIINEDIGSLRKN